MTQEKRAMTQEERAAIIDEILETLRALGLVIDEPEENGSEKGGATV